MARYLPLEILHLIAAELIHSSSNTVLPPYVLVCRRWQSVFGPLNYKQLRVHSSSFGTGSWKLTLAHFKSMLSRSTRCTIRRGMIKRIDYQVNLPHDISDYEPSKVQVYSGRYTTVDAVTRANDEAFSDGITDSFKILASWPELHDLYVNISTAGREQWCEPRPTFYQTTTIIKLVLPPYRARFLRNTLTLPGVQCIKLLVFGPDEERGIQDHQIWPGTALLIARSCPELKTFF
ncbi:hypothetical protein BJX99DRAFT_265329 [Aspergillus californicus]